MDDHIMRTRVFPRLIITGTGCLLWQGSCDPRGYGQVRIAKKLHRVHRLMYEHFHGSLPDGLVLDHLCRNHGCASPDHLEAVTQAENLRRGAKGGVKRGQKTHCPAGHPYTEDPRNGWVYCRPCHNEAAKRSRERKAQCAS